jgi:hypothetical protein
VEYPPDFSGSSAGYLFPHPWSDTSDASSKLALAPRRQARHLKAWLVLPLREKIRENSGYAPKLRCRMPEPDATTLPQCIVIQILDCRSSSVGWKSCGKAGNDGSTAASNARRANLLSNPESSSLRPGRWVHIRAVCAIKHHSSTDRRVFKSIPRGDLFV